MGKYDFDKIIDRRGTHAVKTDALEEMFGSADLTPLWVADMDFATPHFIIEAIHERLAHPVLGYTDTPKEYWQAIIQWIGTHHQWKVEREWLTYIPGIVKGIGMVINVFVKEDEKVIIQPPIYHPFRLIPLGNRRQVVYNPLHRHEDGTYSMDFDNLEKVTDDKCRLLILSNPHNPAGIVWDKETLVRLAAFCHKHHIIVISDEIHCDMALWGNRHIPFATVSQEAADCSITFGAPTKTFNMAGIVSSYTIVPNDKLRQRFFSWLQANEMDAPNMFAPAATIAAFTKGEEWRQEMLRYIEGNIRFVMDFCSRNIPEVKPLCPQASFLVWLDCRRLNLTHNELLDLFIRKAHLALNDGEMFGKEGEGFMRMNVASPRSVLLYALEKLENAIKESRQ
ncbi:MAG: PatB family C-S lyase [Bacteroides sp.]|nr:PatB family C-S lyase [Roseburia sp.]MCM1347092.1 PatB family C-S lyase [Bacteroides sp.]MCM1421613.1 PatB family C-S lyase [Bacteroides sp.]